MHAISIPVVKVLLPVCMKYTARDESQVANIAQGKVECYISHVIKSCIFSYNQSGSVLSVYCILYLLKCQQNTVPWSF